jgi:hypothetical protein
MKLEWKGPQLTGIALDTFRENMQVLDRKINIGIEDPKWAHPRPTRRSKGEIVGSPRNIVDSSQLLQSQEAVEFPNLTTAVFRNSAEYSLSVHEGYTTTLGKVVPPKRFMVQALEEFDLPSSFAALYRVKAGAR